MAKKIKVDEPFNFSAKVEQMLFTYIHGSDQERAVMLEAFKRMAICADRELHRILQTNKQHGSGNIQADSRTEKDI